MLHWLVSLNPLSTGKSVQTKAEREISKNVES